MPAAPRSDRRNEHSRRAILDAVFELAATKGYGKLTIEGIAAAAGVGKPTIYRWWECKGSVALEAITERLGSAGEFPDTGDIAADLTEHMRSTVDMLAGDVGRIYRGILAEAQTDPELMDTVRAEMIDPRVEQCARRLEIAVAAGQLRDDIPIREMVEMFYAPLYYRLLLGGSDLAETPGVIAPVLDGLRPARKER
ncbi:TetR/AcrR family transcriptional regulator [Nocardia sp. NPDC058658]|uniref:TetR/AcrR family transcriptional regulator n=1 Tax=Nocardia sp. NPDC058658 TaxID=3346580 RepID=UPI00364FBAEF